jgi:Rod binding domain-containing protein
MDVPTIPAAGFLPAADDTAGVRDAREAATAVEGMFVSMLVAEMKKSLESGGFFGEGPGSQVFEGMFDSLMGEEIARQGGFGLSAFVEDVVKERAAGHQAAGATADLERRGGDARLP